MQLVRVLDSNALLFDENLSKWIVRRRFHSQKKLSKSTFSCLKSAIVKNKDIRTTLTSSVSLFDFEQVNVCWDVIKSLLNHFWSILKMLCSKYYSRRSYFYWHNALIYSLLNKNARNTFKACVRYFLTIFHLSPNDSPQMFFISSIKLFSFSRYLNFCISSSPLFLPVNHCIGA